MVIPSSLHFPQKTVKHFKLLPSTNDFTSEWCLAAQLPPEGSVVIADFQSHGRGQGANIWSAEAGQNLTFSMVYYPSFLPVERLFALNMIVSLAIVETINTLKIPEISIKWPNDILIEGQKVAGILIRNSLAGKKIHYSIIGIGLNIHQKEFAKPVTRATSLALNTSQQLDKEAILGQIITHFETLYIRLQDGGYEEIKKEYLRWLHLIQVTANYFRPDGQRIEGKIIDVNDTGQLMVETNGNLEAFDFQMIRFA